MAVKKVVSVGYLFPCDDVDNINFFSEQSLFDYDIIIFQPKAPIDPRIFEDSIIQDLFYVNYHISKWKKELKLLYESGKTIIVFLTDISYMYVRNELGERMTVDLYDCLPFYIGDIIARVGKEIKIVKPLNELAMYWSNFSRYSKYRVYLEKEKIERILETKSGGKVVGGFIRNKGIIYFLPPIQHDDDIYEFVEGVDELNGQRYSYFNYKNKGGEFGRLMLSTIIKLDKLSQENNIPLPPEWVEDELYKSSEEFLFDEEINRLEDKIMKINIMKDEITEKINNYNILRYLLYSSGELLENAIIIVLRIIGFSAESWEDAESQFDSVFHSAEGRCIGEAEGKENSAIDTKKLDQLERNIREDFEKFGEDAGYAHPVLFGNAFRFKPLAERGEYFTNKCLSGARRSRAALVRTPDLFPVAIYLKTHDDPDFAYQCRMAILNTEGEIVQFPVIPE